MFLNGPRQSGKSTLVQHFSRTEYPAEYVTFDNTTQFLAAANAPENFLRIREGALIIDEVQLAPEIFRALKTVVDERRLELGQESNGRFLLTGSANVLALPKLADALVGRMGVLTLYPLSGSEALGLAGTFIERLFKNEFRSEGSGAADLIQVIGAATYPEISGSGASGRRTWFDGYLSTILQRDVRSLAEIEKLSAVPNLLRILANRAGGLSNDAAIARDAGLNPVTSRNYRTLLKMLFLVFDVPSWHRNIGKRLVKAPKAYLMDTLLLCHLLQYDIAELERKRPEVFGHVLENFVASELLKLIAVQEDGPELFHFRTSDHKEVDFVLQKANGQLAAVEVKQRDHIATGDFKGLEELQRLTGKDFAAGIVLYRGTQVVPFGENLWAVPFGNLWT